jgi:putative ABC transport system substrate-binding protein
VLATEAVKKVTTTIPIVIANVGDAVATGLVTSLARPGGNITGLTNFSPELTSKGLELLRETFPNVTHVAFLSNPANPMHGAVMKEIEAAAGVLRVELQLVEVRDPNDLDSAFSVMTRRRAGAVVVRADPLFLDHRTRIVKLASDNRLPTIFSQSEYVEAGGLMSYGVNIADLWRRAATYVDKILKGAKPADLPVEQPMKFEFIINLKAAKQIGLTIPQSVLYRADRVIR